MSRNTHRSHARHRRHQRVRNKVSGTAQRPRLNVFRSADHIYAQVIDDQQGHTLVAASSNEKDLRDQLAQEKPVARARKVGELLADRALAQGVTNVIFDRGGFQFHGRVKALADGSRAKGLKF